MTDAVMPIIYEDYRDADFKDPKVYKVLEPWLQAQYKAFRVEARSTVKSEKVKKSMCCRCPIHMQRSPSPTVSITRIRGLLFPSKSTMC